MNNGLPQARVKQGQTSYALLVRRGMISVCLLALVGLTGCAGFHPIRGVPASYMPLEFQGPERNDRRTIDLSLLVRTPPDQYRVDAGDVLAIYVPRVLGSIPTEIEQVGIEPPINSSDSEELPPTVGYPVQVRDDATISLPQIPPLFVGGMTLHEVEQVILKAYTVDHKILNPEEAMVMVSLQRPREYRVLVFRQETGNPLASDSGGDGVNLGTARRGTARVVRLKAYENDVLHALARAEGADGLPGLDAENTIYIVRRRRRPAGVAPGPAGIPPHPPGVGPGLPLTPSPANPVPIVPAPPSSPWQGAMQSTSPQFQPYSNPRIGQGSDRLTVPAGQPAMAGTPANATGIQQVSAVATGGHSLVTDVEVPPPSMATPPSQHSLPSPAPTYPAAPYSMPPGPLPAGTIPPGSFAPGPLPPGALPPAGMVGEGLPTHWPIALQQFDPTIDNSDVVKIPIRLGEREFPTFTEQDITLYDGDIVFIESRDTEVFYTGGLLGGGQYTLPRDYDLGVLEAISIAEARNAGGTGVTRSVGGVSALNRDVANSASRVAILRTLPNGQRVTIEVDLNKAIRYKEENILVQPGDMLILQYTIPEAIAAFTQRFLLEGALIGIATSSFQNGGNN